jgi:hypothetical protein
VDCAAGRPAAAAARRSAAAQDCAGIEIKGRHESVLSGAISPGPGHVRGGSDPSPPPRYDLRHTLAARLAICPAPALPAPDGTRDRVVPVDPYSRPLVLERTEVALPPSSRTRTVSFFSVPGSLLALGGARKQLDPQPASLRRVMPCSRQQRQRAIPSTYQRGRCGIRAHGDETLSLVPAGAGRVGSTEAIMTPAVGRRLTNQRRHLPTADCCSDRRPPPDRMIKDPLQARLGRSCAASVRAATLASGTHQHDLAAVRWPGKGRTAGACR